MEVQSLQETISLLKSQFKFSLQQTYNQQLAAVCATDETNEQNRETLLTSNFLMKRIWAVINRLLSIIIRPAWYLFDSLWCDMHTYELSKLLRRKMLIIYCFVIISWWMKRNSWRKKSVHWNPNLQCRKAYSMEAGNGKEISYTENWPS